MSRNTNNCNSGYVSIDPHTHTAELQALYQLITSDCEFRTLDGSGNNLKNPDFGLKGEAFIRKVPAIYNGDNSNNNDGCTLNDLNGTRPNPRDVSNCIMNQTKPCPNSFCISNMFWVWGQFIAHSISLSRTTDECVNIQIIDETDPLFGEFGEIEFKRTMSVPDSEECSPRNPRQQINHMTPWLDASNVYGDTEERNNFIREFCGGRLKMDCHGLAPLNDSTMENAGSDRGPNFVFGDIRGNENLALASIHTIFVREHNYWACQISELCPELSDEEIYQKARIMVEAEIQAVTYNEFLPILIDECLPTYYYNCEEDPQLANVFAVAAYRLHSMIPSKIIKDIKIRDIFFKSKNLIDCTTNVGSILSHVACGISEELDQKIVDDLRNFLFGEPGMGGMDIAALDIQRGRDHGLGSINDYLACFGFEQINSFADITSNTTLQQKLRDLYRDNPEGIDLWLYFQIRSGETKDSVLDPLNRAIIKDGFTRIRDGDRLWYENRLNELQIRLINNTRLSDIIRRNICECDVPDNVFVVAKPNCEVDCTPSPCQTYTNTNPCFDPCKLCEDSSKITPNSLIFICSYCKCNPCKCIVICDFCGCNPCICICNVETKCSPSKLIYQKQKNNKIFFRHSKYSAYDNKACFKFPNEKRTKCTSDISDLNCRCKCACNKVVCQCYHESYCSNYQNSQSKCHQTCSKLGCKPSRLHDRTSHCKPCKRVYVITCRCKPRCVGRCRNM